MKIEWNEKIQYTDTTYNLPQSRTKLKFITNKIIYFFLENFHFEKLTIMSSIKNKNDYSL